MAPAGETSEHAEPLRKDDQSDSEGVDGSSSSDESPAPQVETAQAGELQPRKCVICLEGDTEILLLPCRHAVLCQECCTTLRARPDGKCPLCRSRILGELRGTFGEDYVRMLGAWQEGVVRIQCSAHAGMYDHVRVLMFTGAVAASGAVACFVVAPVPLVLPGLALATTGFLVGYIPWFITTAAAFEKEGVEQNNSSIFQLFSREDLRSPLVCLTKAVTLAVAGPLATVFFFGPYLAYKFVVRPLMGFSLRALLRGSCFTWVYVVRPGFSMLRFGGNSGYTLTRDACGAAARCISWCADVVRRGLVAINDYVLQPMWHAAKCAANAVLTYVLKPIDDGLSLVLEMIWKHVIKPIGNGGIYIVSCTARGTWHVLDKAVRALAKYVLEPVGRAFVWICRNAGEGLFTVLKFCGKVVAGLVYYPFVYVVRPAAQASARALANGAALAFEYVLLPLARAARRGAAAACRGLGVAATACYDYGVLPLARAARVGAGAACRGLGVAATVCFDYGVVPLRRVVSAAAGALAAAAGAVYAGVVLPVAAGARTAASLAWSTVLAPAGAALLAAARAAFGVLASAASAAASAGQAAGAAVGTAGAAAVKVLQQAFREVAAAVRSVGQMFRFR